MIGKGSFIFVGMVSSTGTLVIKQLKTAFQSFINGTLILCSAVEAFSLGLFLFFGTAMVPSSFGVLFSMVNRRFDIRIKCSSARVAGPSIIMVDEVKLNGIRMSIVRLRFVLHGEEKEDATSMCIVVGGIVAVIGS